MYTHAMYLLNMFSAPPHSCSTGGTGMGVGSFTFGLMAGSGGPCLSWKVPVGVRMLCGLPYTAFAGGAMKRCASVLKTTGQAN